MTKLNIVHISVVMTLILEFIDSKIDNSIE